MTEQRAKAWVILIGIEAATFVLGTLALAAAGRSWWAVFWFLFFGGLTALSCAAAINNKREEDE